MKIQNSQNKCLFKKELFSISRIFSNLFKQSIYYMGIWETTNPLSLAQATYIDIIIVRLGIIHTTHLHHLQYVTNHKTNSDLDYLWYGLDNWYINQQPQAYQWILNFYGKVKI